MHQRCCSLLQVCHARNVHGRTEEEVAAAAARWEAVPPSMPQLDAAAWLKGLGRSQVWAHSGGLRCVPTRHGGAGACLLLRESSLHQCMQRGSSGL